MSDDLKTRLRKFEGGDKYGSTVWYRNPDGPEAADRIEKLEEALQKIARYDMQAVALDALHPNARIRIARKEG